MRFFRQLRKNALFNGFSDAEIEDIFECLDAEVVKYSERDIVFRPGDELKGVYIILEGDLVEFVIGKNGVRKVLSSRVDGDMYGLPNCFLTPAVSNSFVTAATPVTLLFIAADDLHTAEESDPACHRKLVKNLVCYLSKSIADLQQNKDFITIRGMRKKIAAFIYDKYIEQGTLDVRLGVDRNGMARYLNVSRPSMSREMINMREEGVFNFRKDLIQIKDPEALRKIAQD